MRTTYYGNRRGGHCPSHVRQAFIDALEAYTFWETGEPEPQVTFEVDFEERRISISQAAKQVWNCTDILPRGAWSDIEATDLDRRVMRNTYASAARALVEAINEIEAAT